MPLIKSLSFRGLGLVFPGLSQAASLASQSGFNAIDLPLRDLFELKIDPNTVETILADHGLQPGACPFPFDWRSSPNHFQQTLASLPSFLDFINATGVKRLYTRVSESVAEGQSAEETIKWHSERLSQIAGILKTSDINLGLETVGVESFRQGRPPLMHTLSLVRLKLADLFQQHANLGLLVDAFHLHASGESLEDAICGFEHRVIGVHVADLPNAMERKLIVDHHRALPGCSGAVPVKHYLAEMQSQGVNAPVMIETVRNNFAAPESDISKIISRVAESLHPVFPTTLHDSQLTHELS